MKFENQLNTLAQLIETKIELLEAKIIIVSEQGKSIQSIEDFKNGMESILTDKIEVGGEYSHIVEGFINVHYLGFDADTASAKAYNAYKASLEDLNSVEDDDYESEAFLEGLARAWCIVQAHLAEWAE